MIHLSQGGRGEERDKIDSGLSLQGLHLLEVRGDPSLQVDRCHLKFLPRLGLLGALGELLASELGDLARLIGCNEYRE